MTNVTNPFAVMEEIFERMGHQFEQAAEAWETGEGYEFLQPGFRTMAVDVVERDEAYVVTVDVPGFEPDEIDVSMTDRRLTVEAERDVETEEDEEGRFIRREREVESLSRSIRLPEAVVAEEVSATMNDGVLTITVPKAEPEASGRKIEIASE